MQPVKILNLSNFKTIEELLCFVLCSCELRPSVNAVTGLSWNDMDMKMRNRLACALITCIQQIYTGIPAGINTVIDHPFYSQHQMIQGFGIAIENALDVLFRYSEHMTIHISGNIHEYECMLIFIYFQARDIAVYDPAEYTIHFRTFLLIKFRFSAFYFIMIV